MLLLVLSLSVVVVGWRCRRLLLLVVAVAVCCCVYRSVLLMCVVAGVVVGCRCLLVDVCVAVVAGVFLVGYLCCGGSVWCGLFVDCVVAVAAVLLLLFAFLFVVLFVTLFRVCWRRCVRLFAACCWCKVLLMLVVVCCLLVLWLFAGVVVCGVSSLLLEFFDTCCDGWLRLLKLLSYDVAVCCDCWCYGGCLVIDVAFIFLLRRMLCVDGRCHGFRLLFVCCRLSLFVAVVAVRVAVAGCCLLMVFDFVGVS